MRTLSMNRKSFTLIELVIVVAILSIILAVVWPNLEGAIPGVALKSASRRISSTVMHIRQEAVSSGDFYRLVLDMDSQEYFIEKRVQDGEGEWKEERRALLKRYSLPSGVNLEDVTIFGREMARAGLSYIEFYPGGYVESFLIHLRSAGNRFATLSSMSITGRVKIEEGYLEYEGIHTS